MNLHILSVKKLNILSIGILFFISNMSVSYIRPVNKEKFYPTLSLGVFVVVTLAMKLISSQGQRIVAMWSCYSTTKNTFIEVVIDSVLTKNLASMDVGLREKLVIKLTV